MKFVVILLFGYSALVNGAPSSAGCAKYTPQTQFDIEKLLYTTQIAQSALNIPSDPKFNIPACTTSYSIKKDGKYYSADRTGQYFEMNFPDGQDVGHITYNVPMGKTGETCVVEQYFIDSDPSLVDYQVWTICVPIPYNPLTYAYVNHPIGKDISADTMKTIAQNLDAAGFDSSTLYTVQLPNCTYTTPPTYSG